MTLPACDRIIELVEKAAKGPRALKGLYRQDADFIKAARILAPKIAAALNEAVATLEAIAEIDRKVRGFTESAAMDALKRINELLTK